MKKTLTINLNGKVFNIDTDAYKLLDSYISSLNAYFAKDIGKKEIIDDFEGRIQEIFLAKKPNKNDVIDIINVQEMIKVIGNPNEFDTDQTSNATQEGATLSDETPKHKKAKRLYRNPNDKILTGVCSGIAAFFNIDPLIIRALFILFTFIALGTTIILYILLWILVPEANTAEEQLAMCGEPINIENISRVVSENAKSVYNKANNGIIPTIIKLITAALFIIIGIPIIFLLAILTIVVIVFTFSFFAAFYPNLIALSTIASILTLGIPLVAITYGIARAIFKWRPMQKTLKLTLTIMWIVALIGSIVIGTNIDWSKLDRFDNSDAKEWLRSYFYGKRLIIGDGNIVSKNYQMTGDITNIEVKNNLKIDIVEDNTLPNDSVVRVETDDNILERLTIDCNGNGIVIKTQNSKLMLRPTEERIVLKVKNNHWESITLKGASEINITDKWLSDNVIIKLTGAAQLNAITLNTSYTYIDLMGSSEITIADLNTQTTEIKMLGSSEAKITGYAKNANYTLIGASELEATGFITENININASGASEVDIYPTQSLVGKISGASEIIYHNNPIQPINVISLGASSIEHK